jgi:hypothetical protein
MAVVRPVGRVRRETVTSMASIVLALPGGPRGDHSRVTKMQLRTLLSMALER